MDVVRDKMSYYPTKMGIEGTVPVGSFQPWSKLLYSDGEQSLGDIKVKWSNTKIR